MVGAPHPRAEAVNQASERCPIIRELGNRGKHIGRPLSPMASIGAEAGRFVLSAALGILCEEKPVHSYEFGYFNDTYEHYTITIIIMIMILIIIMIVIIISVYCIILHYIFYINYSLCGAVVAPTWKQPLGNVPPTHPHKYMHTHTRCT